MKKLSFSMLAMAGLLLASCADKDVIAESGGQGETRTDGYMALSINLPTTPVTRAANDVFDDGIAEEYNVKDCALLLFQGTSEDNATLMNAQTFTYPFKGQQDDVDDDNITTSYKIAATVSGWDEGNTLYALALLNYQELLNVIDGVPTFKNLVAGQSGTINSFSDIREKITELKGYNENEEEGYFFMANAVMSTKPGGTNPELTPSKKYVFQLAEIDQDKIYDSEAEALENPACEILVERAVAKATVELGTGITPGTTEVGGTNTTPGVKIKSVKWAIDNMEPKTYVIRNHGGVQGKPEAALAYYGYTSGAFTNGYYRFVGNASTQGANPDWGTDKNYYRTYWCIDPLYNEDAKLASESTEENPIDENYMLPATTFYPIDKPLYCHENTFDVEHQTYRNTTRFIVEVEFEGPEDETETTFFTINNSPQVYSESAAKSHFIRNITDNVNFKEALANSLNANQGLNWEEDEFTDYFNLTYVRNENTGVYSIASFAVKSEKVGTDNTFKLNHEFTNELMSQIMGMANANVVVLQYVQGKMYYEARFKHFAGDSNSPTSDYFDSAPWHTGGAWENPAPTSGSGTAADSYPNYDAANYLGRYGMVRNNWYAIEITEFTNFGSPVNPTGKFENPDTPDDKIVDNISVKIHVLSWAKRKQSWSF